MNLREFINDKIEQLDASGDKQAAVAYFKTHVPNLTRQQLNGWRRSSKLPFEIAEAIFEHELQEVEPTPHSAVITDADIDPAANPGPDVPNEEPIYEEDTFAEPEATSPFETADGMTLTPAMSNIGAPGQARPLAGQRHRDIAVIDRRAGTAAAGPVLKPAPIDTATIAAVVEALRLQGWSPPPAPRNPSPRTAADVRARPAAAAPVPVRRVAARPAPVNRIMVRQWNEPLPAR